MARNEKDFVLETVHDLRAPATVIRLAAEKLSAIDFLKTHTEYQEGIELIRQANARICDLIQGLLEEGKRTPEENRAAKVHLDIMPLIEAAWKELLPLAEEKRIKVTYTRHTSTPFVRANAAELKKVFLNLFDNAIKYNVSGGSIMISHDEGEGMLKTFIRDTGKGIPQGELSKIFDPYFRGGSSGDAAGAGLGLYIVKKLVEEMGGIISVESVPGEGTTFTVSLPKVLSRSEGPKVPKD